MILDVEQLGKIYLVILRGISILSLIALTGACTGAQKANSFDDDVNPTGDFEIIDIGDDDQVEAGDIPTREPSPCPGLDSMLTQIYLSTDPLTLAQQLQIQTAGDKIQVLLILEGGETSFLEEYSVEVSKKSGNQVQGFAPIEQLCAIAANDHVIAVRAIPQIIGE